MYVPDGWNSTEQDAGEFNLQNPDFPDGSGLFFWRDVIPVEPDGSHVMTARPTVAGMTDWLRADHQLVVTTPMKVVIGKGLATTTFVVEVADGAVNKVPECAAVKATCFPILTDPGHWDGTWNVASTESSRYYLATIGPVSNRHLLVVALVARADPAAELLRFEKAVAPILDSLDASHVTFNRGSIIGRWKSSHRRCHGGREAHPQGPGSSRVVPLPSALELLGRCGC